MSALAAEHMRLRTVRTGWAIVAAATGVVALASVVHLLGFEAALVDDAMEQGSILTDIGVTMGFVFAAISGSLAITTEFRHGTIRTALLKAPDRKCFLAAKLVTQLAIGALLAAWTTGLALGLADIFLRSRGLALELGTSDTVRLMVGATMGGALFAAVGLAIGTAVRNQVPVVVGLLVWLLFIENLLRAGVPSIARFAPGSLGRAIAADGAGALTSPIGAGALLAAAAAVSTVAGGASLSHRDIP